MEVQLTDLPKYKNEKEIVYTITEDAVAGYTTKIDGYNITNHKEPETGDNFNAKGYLATFITSLMMLAGLMVIRRKKELEEEV